MIEYLKVHLRDPNLSVARTATSHLPNIERAPLRRRQLARACG
jgi:hypothetical protein